MVLESVVSMFTVIVLHLNKDEIFLVSFLCSGIHYCFAWASDLAFYCCFSHELLVVDNLAFVGVLTPLWIAIYMGSDTIVYTYTNRFLVLRQLMLTNL